MICLIYWFLAYHNYKLYSWPALLTLEIVTIACWLAAFALWIRLFIFAMLYQDGQYDAGAYYAAYGFGALSGITASAIAVLLVGFTKYVCLLIHYLLLMFVADAWVCSLSYLSLSSTLYKGLRAHRRSGLPSSRRDRRLDAGQYWYEQDIREQGQGMEFIGASPGYKVDQPLPAYIR